MQYGYARVSTSAQDLANQLDQLKPAGCEHIFHDKLSGLTKERPQLKRLLKAVALGDTIIIPAIDRLSRDTADLLTIARDLKTAGVGLRSLAGSRPADDDRDLCRGQRAGGTGVRQRLSTLERDAGGMTDEAKPFSPAMMSALLAVSRLKGDSTLAWLLLRAEEQADDRHSPVGDRPTWRP